MRPERSGGPSLSLGELLIWQAKVVGLGHFLHSFVMKLGPKSFDVRAKTYPRTSFAFCFHWDKLWVIISVSKFTVRVQLICVCRRRWRKTGNWLMFDRNISARWATTPSLFGGNLRRHFTAVVWMCAELMLLVWERESECVCMCRYF